MDSAPHAHHQADGPQRDDQAAAAPASKKRSRNQADSCTHRRTRLTSSPPTETSASEPSLSDASALIPTSVPDEDTELSDVDSESRLSESSEEPSSDSSSDDDDDADSDLDMDDEQGIVNLRANQGKKPKMKLAKEDLGDELIPFLKDFLPQLKKANDELHARRQAGTLKHDEIELDGEGEGQYIEMDLGLGVLEEKDPNARSLSEDDSGEKTADSSGATTEKDILGKLMGCDRTKDEPGIVEVCDKAAT